MIKSERTSAELYQELAEDRRSDADFEEALNDQMLGGHITVEEALERLWNHLVNNDDTATPVDVEDDDAVGSHDARL